MAALTIFPETILDSFEYNMSFGVNMCIIAPPPFSLIPGETYRVMWNGDEYISVAQDSSHTTTFGEQVCLGDASMFADYGLTGNDEPFLIVTPFDSATVIVPTKDQTSSEHTISIEQLEKQASANIVLKDINGDPQEYENVTHFMIPRTDGTMQTFVSGNVTHEIVDVDFTDGDMVVESGSDAVMNKVTVKKPATLISKHVAAGIDIAGVVGEFEGSGKGIKEKAINFYDVDGNLLYSYTRAEAALLTELPPIPEFDGFTAEWTHTLEKVQAETTFLDIGARYRKNGKATIIAKVESPRQTTTYYFRTTDNVGMNIEVKAYTGYNLSNLTLKSSQTFKRLSNYMQMDIPVTLEPGAGGIYVVMEFSEGNPGIGSVTSPYAYFIGTEKGTTTNSKNGDTRYALLSVVTTGGVQGYAFYDDYRLRYCCGSSMQAPGTYGYYNCTNLQTIVSSTVSLTSAASKYNLYYCYSLKRASIQSTSQYVGNGCQGLDVLRIGASSSYRFEAPCIRTLIITNATPGNPYSISSFLPYIKSIYVPDSAVETFKTHSTWKTYADKIYPISEYPDY